MLKLLALCYSLFLVFDAEAVMVQSASKALSFKNVINDSRANNLPNVGSTRAALSDDKALEHHTEPPITVSADLRENDTQSVFMKTNDSLVVKLNVPEQGYSWKVVSSTTNMATISNKSSGETQIITFKMKKPTTAYIYFDYANVSSNQIEETKMITVKLR